MKSQLCHVPLPRGEGAAKRRVRALIRPFGPPSPGGRRIQLIILGAVFFLTACSQRPSRPPATLAELEQVTAAKSAHEVATYIFDNYGCKNCHTIARDGKFGYTAMGEQLKNKSEGCIAMLTTVSRIVTLPEANRTPAHKEKLTHFNDYGCTSCHRISFGSVELTEVGAKLKTMHLACTDVQRILN